MGDDKPLAIRVSPDTTVHLDAYDPAETHGLKKDEGKKKIAKHADHLTEAQELLYGAARQSVLIVLQGMDTSGKDGTISHVMAPVNPQGCAVVSFKQPTPADLAHDFLWRVHPHAPARGMMAIFNRSHYEDVIVVRVHDLVPKQVWKRRYEAINNFEKLLADNGTIIRKFFLHISKEEQRERLLAREEDPTKAWKLSTGDWEEREKWDDYQAAYEEALSRCSTEYAPWYIVPADKKWFRNLAISEAILDALEPHVPSWRAALEERGKEELASLLLMREQAKSTRS